MQANLFLYLLENTEDDMNTSVCLKGPMNVEASPAPALFAGTPINSNNTYMYMYSI